MDTRTLKCIGVYFFSCNKTNETCIIIRIIKIINIIIL